MITETIYSEFELEKGKCQYCGEKSNEILIGEQMCIDCIEAIKFENQTINSNETH